MRVNFNKKTEFNDEILEYFNKAKRLLDLKDRLGCDVHFVTKCKIKSINKRFRNKNKVTDVLSFPTILNADMGNMQTVDWERARITCFDPQNEQIFLGDIMISLAVAKKQAKEYGHSVKREVCYLAVHGLLHLLGYDHMIENEKAIMRRMEEEILKN